MREQAIKEGRNEGLKQGFKEGIEQGVVKGREENSFQVIKNMLKEGLDVELISKITNKSKEAIMEIKISLEK